MVTTATAELIKRTAPPLAGWVAARIVEQPRVKKTLRRVDAKLVGAAFHHRRALIKRRVLRVIAGLGLVMFGALLIVRRNGAAAAE